MKTIMHPASVNYKEVVRVAVNNNFNCTAAEFRQVDGYSMAFPDKLFFVNCNVNTKKLPDLNKHSYKAVITVNPNLTVRESEIEALYKVRKDLVAFVRVKYLPDTPPIVNLIRELNDEGYPIVITNQRFNSKASLLKYSSLEHYEYSCSRYRLHGKALTKMLALADSLPNVYVCDRQGQGCGACGQCATLTAGSIARLSSLNLSSSGECRFNCPDCYAQHIIKCLVRGMGNEPRYDVIQQNYKQAGRTKHIEHSKSLRACK